MRQIFIGPAAHIGDVAIMEAGTVMMEDVESWGIYVGNLAKYINTKY